MLLMIASLFPDVLANFLLKKQFKPSQTNDLSHSMLV